MLTNNSQRCQADFMWVADRFFEAQGNRLGACDMQKGTATAKLLSTCLSLTSISFLSISELQVRFHADLANSHIVSLFFQVVVKASARSSVRLNLFPQLRVRLRVRHQVSHWSKLKSSC